MIGLDQPAGWITAILLAATMGAIGGLAAELLLRDAAGRFERPRTLDGFWDWGGYASIIVGAVAAVGFLFFFAVEEVTTGAGGTVDSFSVVRLVSISLIVGSSGGSILSAMQERAKALVTGQKLEDLANVTRANLAALGGGTGVAQNGVLTVPVEQIAQAIATVDEISPP